MIMPIATDIGSMNFIIAVIALVLILIVTLAFHVMTTCTQNPIDKLRDE